MIIRKLEILKESNIIDQEIYTYVLSVMNSLNDQGIATDEETPAETFLTHLAMAAARQKNEDPPIERLDSIIREDLMCDPNFSRAQAIWNALENFSPVSFGEEEIDYFYLHICNMIR